jgi:hypothetical protein
MEKLIGKTWAKVVIIHCNRSSCARGWVASRTIYNYIDNKGFVSVHR